jgi:hypothetical protein
LTREAEASRAEHELLLSDDKGTDENLKGYNLKRKKMKRKKGKEAPDEEKLPTVDYDDPRFAPFFTSPLFALDPTDRQFKRYFVYLVILAPNILLLVIKIGVLLSLPDQAVAFLTMVLYLPDKLSILILIDEGT